jgi:hypothetical protein
MSKREKSRRQSEREIAIEIRFADLIIVSRYKKPAFKGGLVNQIHPCATEGLRA